MSRRALRSKEREKGRGGGRRMKEERERGGPKERRGMNEGWERSEGGGRREGRKDVTKVMDREAIIHVHCC